MRNASDGQPVSDARVTAAVPSEPDTALEAVTDAAGRFAIPLTLQQSRELLGGRRHRELTFKVYDGIRYLGGQTTFISAPVFHGMTSVSLTVDADHVPPSGGVEYTVSGSLLQEDGTPSPGKTIAVYRRDLRTESLLASGSSDSSGRFIVRYVSTGSTAQPAQASFSIRVAALDGQDEIASTERLCNPTHDLHVRLVHNNGKYRGPSEFELFVATLDPLRGAVDYEELTVDDIEHLACRTGYDGADIATLARAHKVASALALSPAALYAIARAGYPLAFNVVLGLRVNTVRQIITAAIDNHIVHSSLLYEIQAVEQAILEGRLERTVRESDEGATALGGILTAAALLPGLPFDFARRYLNNIGTTEAFWAALRADPDYGNVVVDSIQFTLQAGALTGGHIPLVKLLNQKRTGLALFSRAAELARLTEQDWIDLLNETVDGTPVGTPPGVVGHTETERRAAYGAAIARMVEDLYPSAHIAYHLPEGVVQSPIAEFVVANPGFSFERTRISEFLPGAHGLPNDPEDLAVLQHELLKVQRVFRLAPRIGRTATASTLMTDGIVSARQIQRMGQGAFRARYAGSLGEATSDGVFDKADRIASTALTAFVHMRPAMHSPATNVLTTPGCSDPDLEVIFGSLDYCACRHCESVYGPAAYFVDVMQLLRDRYIEPNVTALSKLLARRPELPFILLNCENSDTPLPTIDLVNETLEREFLKELNLWQQPADDAWPQTTWSASDLLAHPEHIQPLVYEKLRDVAIAHHPWALPFDLRLEEARAYLEHLEAPRIDLQDAFEYWTPESATYRVDERLGLSRAQGKIVRNEDGTPDLWKLWGISAQAAYLTTLNDVEDFLGRAELDFPGLQALLRTNILAGVEIAYDEPCTLKDARFVRPANPNDPGLDESRLARLQVFFRVRRGLGWSTGELDAAMRALGLTFASATVTADLQTLARFVRTRRRFPRLSLGELLSWWAPLATYAPVDGEPSYYEEITRPRTRELTFAVGTIVNGDGSTFEQRKGSVLGILQLSEADLAAAYQATGLTGASTVTLASLSRLYRVASIARAVGLSVPELVALTSYTQLLAEDDPGPFAGVAAAPVEALLDIVAAVRQSGFSVGALDWIIRDRNPEKFGASDPEVVRTLVALITTLQRVDGDHEAGLPPADLPALDRLAQTLPLVLEGDDITLALDFVQKLYPEGVVDAPLAAQTRNALFPFLTDPSEAFTELGQSFAAAGTVDDRATLAYDALEAWVRRQRREQAVVQQLAKAIALEPADTQVLLETYTEAATPLLTLFTADEFFALDAYDAETDAEALKDDEFAVDFFARPAVAPRAALYRALRKVAFVTTGFRFAPGFLRWLLLAAPDAPVAILDLTALPDGNDPAEVYVAYSGWDWLRRAIRLRDTTLAAPQDLTPLLQRLLVPPAQLDKPGVLTALATSAEWNVQEVIDFEADDPIPAADFQSLVAIDAIVQAFTLSERLGVAVETVRAWATAEEPSASQAAAIKGAAQARYSPQTWVGVAQPLRDRLRERQRDAMVAFLLPRISGVADREDLFGRLLLDVDIAACGRTSRLLFATAAVQLFVQRALMGLEPGVVLAKRDADEWVWMKRYRLWEANRKIFLYPENWVAPELRDDKTPLFKKLEEEIGQSEPDATTVERAYLHYLEGLHEISRLEICGMYHEVERDDVTHKVAVDNLHVFGRTPGEPSKVYYRKRIDDAYWTAWEELPFPVEAPDVVPVIAYRRLLLIWPKVELRPKKPSEDALKAKSAGSSAKEPEQQRHIRLMWSELRDGEWSKVATTETAVINPNVVPPREADDRELNRDISLTTEIVEDDLVVRCLHFDGFEEKPPALPEDMEGVFFLPKSFRYNPRTGKFDTVGFEQDPSMLTGLSPTFPTPKGLRPFFQAFATAPWQGDRDELSLPVYDPVDLALEWSPSVLNPKDGFEVLFPRQDPTLESGRPFVYSDRRRRFYIRSEDRLYVDVPSDAAEGQTDVMAYGTLNILPYFAFTESRTTAAPPMSVLPVADILSGAETAASANTLVPLGPEQLATPTQRYRISVLYHPYTWLFLEQTRRHGVEGLLSPNGPEDSPAELLMYQRNKAGLGEYLPNPNTTIAKPYPVEDIDFRFGGAYSVYNWELFFHIPMYIADRLMAERRFADAQRWLGYVFNPIRTPTVIAETDCKYYWRIRPFREAAAKMSIDDLLRLLHDKNGDDEHLADRRALLAQIDAWRRDPFRPHAIARMRPTAYMRAVVMKYLDNLIAWGDDLFREDTRESTNEALQLYVLALQILGKRPRELDAHEREDVTYHDAIDPQYGFIDDFSNFMVALENEVAGDDKDGFVLFDLKAQSFQQKLGPNNVQMAYVVPQNQAFPLAAKPQPKFPPSPPLIAYPLKSPDSDPVETGLYFCIPPNTKLLGYWDIVADRLFKLRNCLNLEGIRRDLALFAPPIDPALLAKAAAQGVDIATAISNLNAPLPNYRFLTHLGIAKEFAGQVTSLGSALLQALEKRDAEELALLRAGQEVRMQASIRQVRVRAIDEANENIESLRRGVETAQKRYDYYSTRERMNKLEIAENVLQVAATVLDVVGGALMLAGSVAAPFPNATFGVAGWAASPVATVQIGGGGIGASLQMAASSVNIFSGAARGAANILGAQASYSRRKEEWNFQADLALKDKAQLEKQITAAEIRRDIVTLELDNHDKQAADSVEALELMRSRFTNQELYAWMADELGKVHRQAYQLAIDLARRTEVCYRYELAKDSDFIKIGGWDNRRQGLLAGEVLSHDLRRMEASYYENNRREYELTKRISLASLDPVALVALRKTGACHFLLPSVVFDLDHSSHYMRRIKLVSVTLPAVTGPYTDVGVTLTYEGGQLRKEAGGAIDDDLQSTGQTLAMNAGQEDTGMFEPNLRDERYLPFEGKGLENSKWRLELPARVRQFDYETVSDVILTVRFTAREGGSTQAAVIESGTTLSDALVDLPRADIASEPERGVGQVRLFSARTEFPEAWRTFVAAGADNGPAELALDLSEARFPEPQLPLGDRQIEFVALFVRWRAEPAAIPVVNDDALKNATLGTPSNGSFPLPWNTAYKPNLPDNRPNYLWLATAAALQEPVGVYTLSVAEGWPAGKEPEDVFVLVQHKLNP